MPRHTPLPSIVRPRLAGCFAVAAPLLLAGLLPLQPRVSERWGWSGSWVYPVGNPYTLSLAAPNGSPPYRVMRGVSDRDSGGSRHQGADLSNGCPGDPVYAAGNGLVVCAAGKGWHHGFGSHVVLAHRLGDGSIVYSVYAHLATGSMALREGQFVPAGRKIGRVGMTGRATSPHLHFEVRRPRDPGTRWEKAPVVDPLAFVSERLPRCQGDSTWARPYLEWAECAGLIAPGEAASERLSREQWWRALAATARHPIAVVPVNAESLRRALVDADLLPARADGGADDPLAWGELERDLERAHRRGLRLPVSPVGRTQRRADCRRELAVLSPAHGAERSWRNTGGVRRAPPSAWRSRTWPAIRHASREFLDRFRDPSLHATPPASRDRSETDRRASGLMGAAPGGAAFRTAAMERMLARGPAAETSAELRTPQVHAPPRRCHSGGCLAGIGSARGIRSANPPRSSRHPPF